METVWADVPELDQLYLEVKVSPALGVLVIQETREEDPFLVFCSLFPEPQSFFNNPTNRREFGVTIAQLRGVIAHIEAKLAARPFPPARPPDE